MLRHRYGTLNRVVQNSRARKLGQAFRPALVEKSVATLMVYYISKGNIKNNLRQQNMALRCNGGMYAEVQMLDLRRMAQLID